MANFVKNDSLANGYDDGYAVTASTGYSASQNYLTDVGSYSSSPSYYGTFDQGGNVSEWNEDQANVGGLYFQGLRGGSWSDIAQDISASGAIFWLDPTFERPTIGFRVATIVVPEPPAYPLFMFAALFLSCNQGRCRGLLPTKRLMRRQSIWCALCVLLSIASKLGAAIDQQYVPARSNEEANVGAANSIDWAQTFQVSITGMLTGFDIWVERPARETLPLLFDIRTAPAGIPSVPDVGPNILASGSLPGRMFNTYSAVGGPVPSNLPHVELNSLAFPVVAGEALAIVLRSDDPGDNGYAWRGNTPGGYTGDSAFHLFVGIWKPSDHDQVFRTYVTAVPEPSACLLCASATFVLLGAYRARSIASARFALPSRRVPSNPALLPKSRHPHAGALPQLEVSPAGEGEFDAAAKRFMRRGLRRVDACGRGWYKGPFVNVGWTILSGGSVVCDGQDCPAGRSFVTDRIVRPTGRDWFVY